MSESLLDRRSSHRYNVDLSVTSIDSIDCQYSIKNINNFGIFIETNIYYDVGAKFILTFKLPEQNIPITCYCEVIWNSYSKSNTKNSNGVGVNFINISEFDKKRIIKYIENNLREEVNSDFHTLFDYSHASNKSYDNKIEGAYSYVNDIKNKGYYTYRRPLVSPSSNKVLVFDETIGKTKEMIMMGSNNYLGLADHPKVIEAASNAIKKYGLGTASAPMLSGTFNLHKELEERLADFIGKEEVLVFPSGYSASVGSISGLISSKDFVVVDRLSHASLIDGCLMSGVKFRTFKHNNVDSLDQVLNRNKDYENKLIVVEGVYSMEGDTSPLSDIYEIAIKHNAKILIDEAHSLGVLGENGSGLTSECNLKGKIDYVLGTFSKSLGQMGGFVGSSKEVINYLRAYGRSYFFSASPPPVIIASVMQALELIIKEPERRAMLWDNINYFKENLISLGFNLLNSNSAIIPIFIGDELILRKMSKRLHEENIYINPIPYPATPRNQTVFRASIMATHTRDDLDRTIEALEIVGKEFQIIGDKISKPVSLN